MAFTRLEKVNAVLFFKNWLRAIWNHMFYKRSSVLCPMWHMFLNNFMAVCWMRDVTFQYQLITSVAFQSQLITCVVAMQRCPWCMLSHFLRASLKVVKCELLVIVVYLKEQFTVFPHWNIFCSDSCSCSCKFVHACDKFMHTSVVFVHAFFVSMSYQCKRTIKYYRMVSYRIVLYRYLFTLVWLVTQSKCSYTKWNVAIFTADEKMVTETLHDHFNVALIFVCIDFYLYNLC